MFRPRYAVVMTLSMSSWLAAQPRYVPFAADTMYTGPEIEAMERELEQLERRREALQTELQSARTENRETADIENRLAGVEQAIEDMLFLPEDLRELGRQMSERTVAIKALVPDRFGPSPIGVEQARQLSELLYDDFGAPEINYRWQGSVVAGFREASQHPDISPEACGALRDGLLAYYEGQQAHHGESHEIVSPLWMYEMANAMFRVSEPGDSEVREAVARLRDGVMAWTRDLQRPEEHEHFGHVLGYLLETAKELDEAAPGISVSSQEGQGGLEARAREPAVVKAKDAKRIIMSQLRRFNWSVGKLREITRLATADYGTASVNRDMISMLLVAYRRILEKPRKAVSREVIQAIDANLLRLAKDSERLTTDRHWRLWGRATAALGKKASTETRRFIASRRNVEQLQARTRALECAWRGISGRSRRSGAPKSLSDRPSTHRRDHP